MNTQYYSHLCACGCGGKIEIKKSHKYDGIPKYINGHHFKGKNHLEESKEKIRVKALGRKYSEETIQKRVQKLKGQKRTKETRQKISEGNKGKKRTEEQKKAASERVSGENHPMYGKTRSEETRQKISEAHKGKIVTEETRLKIRNKALGRKHSEEENRKNSERNKGKKNAMYGIRRYGEQSPNWSGGTSFEPYAPEFNKDKKQQVLERDNYKCQDPNCDGNHEKLHIHHIDYDKTNNNPENLIALCSSCHAKTIGKNKRQYFTEFYQNIMMGKIMECLL